MQGTTSKDGPGIAKGLENLTPEELLREGNQHFKAKDFAQARACFERYVELVPSDAKACHLLARVYYHENDNLDKAAECLENAVRLDPAGASRFYQTMAEIYIHLGEFIRAEEVLVEAQAADPGGDAKHTYAIDFYLNLVRRKNKGKGGPAGSGKEPPEYYTAKADTRYNRKGRHLFLLPSVLVHVAVLLFMAYLSGTDLHVRDEAMEYMYVDVGEIAEEQVQPYEAAGESAEGVADASPDSADSERGRVETGAPGRSGAVAGIEGEAPEFDAEGPRSLSADKAAAALDAAPSSDDAAALETGEKSVDLAARARPMADADVNFRPGALGLDADAGESAGKAEARAGVMSERRDAPAAGTAGTAGIQAGGDSRTGGVKGAKASAALKGGQAAGSGPAPSGSAEKSVAIDRPARAGADELFADASVVRSTPGTLGIGGPGARDGQAGGSPSAESIGSVERGGLKVAPHSFDAGTGTGTAAKGGPGLPSAGGKMSGISGLSGGGGESAVPELSARAERASGIQTARPGRGISGPEALPAPRSLGISVGGTDAQTGGGSAKRAAPGAPTGLSDRRGSAAPAGAGGPAGAGVELGGGSRGYSAAAGKGKGVSSGALSSGSSDAAGTGMIASGDKAAAVAARRGPSGTPSAPEGAPRRGGGLEGLVKDAPGGGGGGGGSGGQGSKRGVKLGTGEKSGTAAVPGKGLAGLPGGGGKSGSSSREKRDAQGALGVPGGQGQERYDALAKASAGSLAPEKKPGVQASKAGVRGVFGPSVKILTPAPGRTSELTQVVTGIVSDPRMTKATLTVNNDSRVVSVNQGRFEAVVALEEGRNVITVMAFDRDGNAGKDSVAVSYSASRSTVPVNIAEPRQGQVFDVSRSNTIKVRGTIGDPDITRARMILNGRPKDILVKDGRFSQEIALTQEKNAVMVEAVDDEGNVSASGVVGFTTINIEPKDIMIILTWDKPNADFDLHVLGPLGGHSSYKSPNIYESNEAIAGAQIEQDAKGNFGPEVFTMENSEKGVYSIRSNYFYSGGDGDAHATVTVILYGDNPARRIVRVYGPHLQVDTKTGEEMWDVARFRMPEGIFLED